MISRQVLMVLFSAGVLASCSMGPPARAPEVSLPPRYSIEALPGSLGTGTENQAIEAGGQTPSRWWLAYGSDALNELVKEGLEHSPSLSAAQANLKASREALRAQIGSSLYPQVDAAFAPSRQRALALPGLPEQTLLYNVFALEVQASYTIDFFGAAVHADRALAGQVQQQAHELDATRRALAANIVMTTIAVAALDEETQSQERLVALAEENTHQLAGRLHHGAVATDEAQTAELAAANAAANLPALRAQLLALRHSQAVLLGRNPADAPPPLSLEALRLPDKVPLVVPSELVHQRLDILAAEAAVKVAANEADAAAAALFPSFTLSAAYGHGAFDWSTFTSPQGAIWSVGASLTQPLFHGGALQARKRQYLHEYEAAVAQYRQVVLTAFENVADSLANLEQDSQALQQSLRAAEAAQRIRAQAVARYRLGGLPYSATLSAGETDESARLGLVRARAARLSDTAALFQALGAMPDAD
jgi:NodT family efflux transporter outer membrane factor (OMF) lipoprotein